MWRLIPLCVAAGCAGTMVQVRRTPTEPLDVVAIAGLEVDFKADETARYLAEHQVVEALRGTGALVIDASETDVDHLTDAVEALTRDLARPVRVGILNARVSRLIIDQKVEYGLPLGLHQATTMRFRVVSHRVELRLHDPQGKVVTRVSAETTREADAAGALEETVRAAAGLLANDPALRPLRRGSNLSYVDTHERLARGKHDAYRRVWPDLPTDWIDALTAAHAEGVLLTQVPGAWVLGGVLPGDVVIRVDGRPALGAAAVDRHLLVRDRRHELEVVRDGRRIHAVVEGEKVLAVNR